MADQEIPDLEQIKDRIANLEKRAQIRFKEHLGFGALHTTLKTKKTSCTYYHGEINESGEEHGRGIYIDTHDAVFIYIAYFENGGLSTGNFIEIDPRGEFAVGERYLKDGEIWRRGTDYKKDGTEEQYDRA